MNHIRYIIGLLAVIFLIQGCAQVAQQSKAQQAFRELVISRVSVDKKVFSPLADRNLNVRFHVSGSPKQVKLLLYDLHYRHLRTIMLTEVSKGFNAIIWDGKDNKDKLVQSDIVYYLISAVGENKSFTYNPIAQSAGREIMPHSFTFDKATGKIEYVLPRAARVRIRAGLKNGGPLLNTILDWLPKQAGKHEFTWDGKDSSGNFALLKHPDLELKFTAYTLADNTIIIKEGRRDIPENTQVSLLKTKKVNQSNKYFHYLHSADNCHEPQFSITFPEGKLSKEGLPMLSAKVPIKIEIAPQDKDYMINKRFEVMFFVDSLFLYEEEEGFSPFTFYWDTSRLNKGEHLLTVNIMSYDDHIGTKTEKVIIEDSDGL